MTESMRCYTCTNNALVRYRVSSHKRRNLFDESVHNVYVCGDQEHRQRIKQDGTILAVISLDDTVHIRKVKDGPT